MEDVLQAFENQVAATVKKYHEKVAQLMVEIQEQMDADDTPIAVRGASLASIVMDLQAKYHASIIATYQSNPAQVAKAAADTLEKTILAYHTQMMKDLGEHNVHGNPVGEELPPESSDPRPN